MGSVCVVGNSSNLLKEDMGSKIDSCDVVIRIQRFKLAGFEKHVGSKTTIASLAWRNYSRIKNSIEYSNIDINKTKLWSAHPLVRSRASCAISVLGHNNILQPTSDFYNSIIDKLYSNHWRKVPSSGIMTIELARNYFQNDDIYICGFDDSIEKDHYYDLTYIDKLSPNEPGPGHNWKSEWEHIQNLIKEEKIKHIRNKPT
jgi:hypothetical protein